MNKVIQILKINILSILQIPFFLLTIPLKILHVLFSWLATVAANMNLGILGLGICFSVLSAVYGYNKGGVSNLFFYLICTLLLFVVLLIAYSFLAVFLISVLELLGNLFKGIYRLFYKASGWFYDTASEAWVFFKEGKKKTVYIAGGFYNLSYVMGKIILGFLTVFSNITAIVGVPVSIYASHMIMTYGFKVDVIHFKSFIASYNIADIASYTLLFVAIGIYIESCFLSLRSILAEWKKEMDYYFAVGEIKYTPLEESEISFTQENYDSNVAPYIEKFVECTDKFKNLLAQAAAVIDAGIEKDFMFQINSLDSTYKEMNDIIIKLLKKCRKQDTKLFEIKYDEFQTIYSKLEEMLPELLEKMKNPCYGSKYFSNCKDKEALQKKYRSLCKELHPDSNKDGNTDRFVEMQTEYETIMKKFVA